MKAEVPSYIIKYIHCPQEGHDDQKVNLICLNPECHQHSLICSLCTPKHKGHAYKPIKIYLDQLYRKYKHTQNNYGQDIEQLQKRKLLLLHHLKNCVQKISQEFMHLQEDILVTFQKIKEEIHENQVRRSRFEEFYLSMIKDNYGDPHFEVKNYLFKDQISILTDQDIFQPILASVQREIKKVRGNFISDQKHIKKLETAYKIQQIDNKTSYLLPNSITLEGENFIQTNLAQNAPNLCLFNKEISQWVGKMKVQITTLPVGSKVTFGLIRKQQFLKANHIFKETMFCMYVDSAGKSKLAQYNHIGVMAATNTIEFYVKRGNFRISCKSNNAIINLGDKNYYFFFAMEGGCKLKLTYPYSK